MLPPTCRADAVVRACAEGEGCSAAFSTVLMHCMHNRGTVHAMPVLLSTACNEVTRVQQRRWQSLDAATALLPAATAAMQTAVEAPRHAPAALTAVQISQLWEAQAMAPLLRAALGAAAPPATQITLAPLQQTRRQCSVLLVIQSLAAPACRSR